MPSGLYVFVPPKGQPMCFAFVPLSLSLCICLCLLVLAFSLSFFLPLFPLSLFLSFSVVTPTKVNTARTPSFRGSTPQKSAEGSPFASCTRQQDYLAQVFEGRPKRASGATNATNARAVEHWMVSKKCVRSRVNRPVSEAVHGPFRMGSKTGLPT